MADNESSLNSFQGLSILFGNPDGLGNLQTVLETIPSAAVLVDAGGKFIYVNKHGIDLYGIDHTGSGMDQHISRIKAHRLDGTPFHLDEMPVSQSLQSGQVVRNVEIIIQNAKGVQLPVNVSSAPLYDANSKIGGAIVIFEDFSQRREKEKERIDTNEELAQWAEDKYHKLVNSIDQGFFLIDIIFDENDKPVDMYYLEANDAATKMLGAIIPANGCGISIRITKNTGLRSSARWR